MKKSFKIVVIIVILFVFVTVINAMVGGWVSYNINRYIDIAETKVILPNIEELGEYEDIDFKFYRNNMLIFKSDAYILKTSYNDENYEKEKERITKNYSYQTESVRDIVDKNTYEKEPYFIIDTFNMKMLSLLEYDLEYPEELIFIGTSDENKSIAYVYYYNQDLDYIDNSFERFLKEDCGW